MGIESLKSFEVPGLYLSPDKGFSAGIHRYDQTGHYIERNLSSKEVLKLHKQLASQSPLTMEILELATLEREENQQSEYLKRLLNLDERLAADTKPAFVNLPKKNQVSVDRLHNYVGNPSNLLSFFNRLRKLRNAWVKLHKPDPNPSAPVAIVDKIHYFSVSLVRPVILDLFVSGYDSPRIIQLLKKGYPGLNKDQIREIENIIAAKTEKDFLKNKEFPEGITPKDFDSAKRSLFGKHCDLFIRKAKRNKLGSLVNVLVEPVLPIVLGELKIIADSPVKRKTLAEAKRRTRNQEAEDNIDRLGLYSPNEPPFSLPALLDHSAREPTAGKSKKPLSEDYITINTFDQLLALLKVNYIPLFSDSDANPIPIEVLTKIWTAINERTRKRINIFTEWEDQLNRKAIFFLLSLANGQALRLHESNINPLQKVDVQHVKEEDWEKDDEEDDDSMDE